MPSILLKIFKGELRTVIALSVIAVALVSWSLAADSDGAINFDFGDGQGVAAGFISVVGNSSTYPQANGEIKFGWLDSVMIKSHGSAVADLRLRDANVGIEPARFKISELSANLYTVHITSGDKEVDLATKISSVGRNYLIRTQPNQWNSVIFSATPAAGVIELAFSRIGTTQEDLWGVNYLTLTPATDQLPPPIFDLSIQPVDHTVQAGGQAVYRVSVFSPNNYASQVSLALTGLAPTMTAQITPSDGLPPFTSDIRIITTQATPATIYKFDLQALGKDTDAYTVNKQISLTVTSLPSESAPNQLNLLPTTMAEMRSAQEMIDIFIKKIRDQRIVDWSQIRDLDELSQIDIMPGSLDIEAAKDNFGSVLQYLTKAGIISSVVDYAPPSGSDTAEPPTGFWRKLLGTFSNPVR